MFTWANCLTIIRPLSLSLSVPYKVVLMSLINEYRATESAIKELQERLKNLSQDDKLQTELEFEGKLRTLMGEYSEIATRHHRAAGSGIESKQSTTRCR
jgi:predicted nuclease with TOPRIM domain